jgi:hypothetical protein
MPSYNAGVAAEGAIVELMLAYSRPTVFAELQAPVGDIRQVSATVLRRAQELGSQADHLRVTRTAKVDLDKTPGIETVVEASSWPTPGSTEKGQSLDFVGIFVLSEAGQPLGEKFDLRGREDQEARFSRELFAIAKSPFDEGWDFLIEEKFVDSHSDDDVDVNLGGTEPSSSLPAQTFYRSIGVWRYLAGEFTFRRNMRWIQSKTCFGTDCAD